MTVLRVSTPATPKRYPSRLSLNTCPMVVAVIQTIDLNVGGLVGALASVEGTGRFITGVDRFSFTKKRGYRGCLVIRMICNMLQMNI